MTVLVVVGSLAFFLGLLWLARRYPWLFDHDYYSRRTHEDSAMNNYMALHAARQLLDDDRRNVVDDVISQRIARTTLCRLKPRLVVAERTRKWLGWTHIAAIHRRPGEIQTRISELEARAAELRENLIAANRRYPSFDAHAIVSEPIEEYRRP